MMSFSFVCWSGCLHPGFSIGVPVDQSQSGRLKSPPSMTRWFVGILAREDARHIMACLQGNVHIERDSTDHKNILYKLKICSEQNEFTPRSLRIIAAVCSWLSFFVPSNFNTIHAYHFGVFNCQVKSRLCIHFNTSRDNPDISSNLYVTLFVQNRGKL